MCYPKCIHLILFSSLMVINFIATVESVVMDPALFLLPSPPTQPNKYTDSPQDRWHSDTKLEKSLEDLKKIRRTSYEGEELMENVETFWPRLRAGSYGMRIVPLSFSASGTYGKYSDNTQGIIASSYISGSEGIFENTQKHTIPGGYRPAHPGIRLYSGSAKPAWSGWGNGRWGHYGKG